MLASVTSNVTLNTALNSSGSSSSAATTAEAAQDRFLKLLVAQLNNQDPMNPMDNAEMTTQMAQINTVTGIQQVNETLKSMAAQFTALQVLQGSNMVGHDVLFAGNTMSLKDGTAQGSFDLAARAESVKVEVMSPGGQVLETLNLGALDGGRHSFEWDASDYGFASPPSLRVTATLGGKTIESTPLARATVQSVSSQDGAMKVQLVNGASIDYSSVKAIL